MKKHTILSLLVVIFSSAFLNAQANSYFEPRSTQMETQTKMPTPNYNQHNQMSSQQTAKENFSNRQSSQQTNPYGQSQIDSSTRYQQESTIRPIAHVEQTLSIVKPDAVENNHIGDIISRFERSGLKIAGIKMVSLTKEQAGQFYNVHRERPFYPELVEFMSSGPVVVLILEGENAIAKNRELMGATNPQTAKAGTIRADFAQSVSRNAVHGSDSPQAAQEEILFFFKPNEKFTWY